MTATYHSELVFSSKKFDQLLQVSKYPQGVCKEKSEPKSGQVGTWHCLQTGGKAYPYIKPFTNQCRKLGT